jgi:hypothetical protein
VILTHSPYSSKKARKSLNTISKKLSYSLSPQPSSLKLRFERGALVDRCVAPVDRNGIRLFGGIRWLRVDTVFGEQSIDFGFEHGEPLVVFLDLLGFFLDLLRDRALLRIGSLLEGIFPEIQDCNN